MKCLAMFFGLLFSLFGLCRLMFDSIELISLSQATQRSNPEYLKQPNLSKLKGGLSYYVVILKQGVDQ